MYTVKKKNCKKYQLHMGQWPKHQIVKLLGENIGLNTQIFEFDLCSLVMMPKSWKTIEKINWACYN